MSVCRPWTHIELPWVMICCIIAPQLSIIIVPGRITRDSRDPTWNGAPRCFWAMKNISGASIKRIRKASLDIWTRPRNYPQSCSFCGIKEWLEIVNPFEVQYAALWVHQPPMHIERNSIQPSCFGFLKDIWPKLGNRHTPGMPFSRLNEDTPRHWLIMGLNREWIPIPLDLRGVTGVWKEYVGIRASNHCDCTDEGE